MKILAPSPERERARLEAERVRIEQERLREEARHERALQQVQHQAEIVRQNNILREERQARATADAEAQRERTRTRLIEARGRWAERARLAGRLAVMSVTNLGVNLVAVAGQFLVFRALGWPILLSALGAGIVESVAVYVSWHAHVALREGDAAFVTRMWAYLIGAGAAWLNYSHVPQFPELFAACSLASPWLWSMHSRHLHRAALREQGLIDPRAPKFSALRWALHTGETFTAFRWAVGEGVQSPHAAVSMVRQQRTVEATRRAVADTQAMVIAAQRTQLQLALTHMAALSQELYDADPNTVAAVENIARFVNRVGAGLIPMYRPLPAGAHAAADETRTDAADEGRTDGGRKPNGRLRWADLVRGRSAPGTADGDRTNGADESRTDGADSARTDGGQKPDGNASSARTNGAGGKPRPRGRSAVKAADGARTNGRTVRAKVAGRTTRTAGRSAGPDDFGDVLEIGRTIRDEHQARGERLTRDRLSAAMKEHGRTIANDRAGRLLAKLRTEADEQGSSAQKNDAPTGADEADGNPSSADDKENAS
ncbi:DUF2637 domain-containing protein [Sphaerisporangium viridialbum]|uniref:DUF2637 domain-containing protein n=1 Tax=Sphaerisporangium viridialbum TaxID=46189 RepID=UPI003C721983